MVIGLTSMEIGATILSSCGFKNGGNDFSVFEVKGVQFQVGFMLLKFPLISIKKDLETGLEINRAFNGFCLKYLELMKTRCEPGNWQF